MLSMRSYQKIHKILSGLKIYPAENNLPLIEHLKTNGLVGSSSPHSPTLPSSSWGPGDKNPHFLFFLVQGVSNKCLYINISDHYQIE